MRKNAKKGRTLFGLLAVLTVVCASRGALAAELPVVTSSLPVGIAAYTTLLASDFGQKLLGGMVDDGVITEEQADAIKTDWATNIETEKSTDKAIEEGDKDKPAKNERDSRKDNKRENKRSDKSDSWKNDESESGKNDEGDSRKNNESESGKNDASKSEDEDKAERSTSEESEQKFSHFPFRDRVMLAPRSGSARGFGLISPDFSEFVDAGIIDQETADKMTEYMAEKYSTYNPFADLVEKGIIDEETAENMLEYLREFLARGEGILELPTIDRSERPIFKWERRGIQAPSEPGIPAEQPADSKEPAQPETPANPDTPPEAEMPTRNINT